MCLCAGIDTGLTDCKNRTAVDLLLELNTALSREILQVIFGQFALFSSLLLI